MLIAMVVPGTAPFNVPVWSNRLPMAVHASFPRADMLFEEEQPMISACEFVRSKSLLLNADFHF